jgi:hypothetical protein
MRLSPNSQPGHPTTCSDRTEWRQRQRSQRQTASNKACPEGAATVPVSHRKAAPSLSCGNQGLGRSRVRPKVTQSALQRFRPGPSEGKPGVSPQFPWDASRDVSLGKGKLQPSLVQPSHYLSFAATGVAWPSGPLPASQLEDVRYHLPPFLSSVSLHKSFFRGFPVDSLKGAPTRVPKFQEFLQYDMSPTKHPLLALARPFCFPAKPSDSQHLKEKLRG